MTKYYVTVALLILVGPLSAKGQTSTFTYQGRLTDNMAAASGTFQMQFALYDAVTGGTQIGSTVENPAVSVSNGVFTVQLDYGATAFPGAERYLEISVRRNSGESFVPLNPRQRVTAVPHAIRAASAAAADNASSLGGAPSVSYVQTSDPRLSDARTPTSGSGNYIQNTTTQQPTSNFNISGSGHIQGGLTLLGTVGVGLAPTSQIRLNAVESVGGRTAISGTNSFVGNSHGTGVVGQSVNGPSVGTGGRFAGGYIGVSGRADSSTSPAAGFGVYGEASGSAGIRYGVYGASSVNAGTNLAFGVYGVASGPAATNYGIYGTASGGTSNWSGYFVGDVYISNKVGVGTPPSYQLHIYDPSNTGLRVQTDVSGGTVASFGGFGAFQIDAPGAPGGRFQVAETGQISFGTLGAAGNLVLCRNAQSQISGCSSSLRYKENITPFGMGLNLIDQLHPIGFRWKADGMADVGFGAEDVARIDPRFVTYNAQGEVEGVKYDRMSVVFVNAFKEQQVRIEAQQRQIESQQKQIGELKAKVAEIDALKRLVCAQNKDGAAVCKQDK